MPAAKIPDNEQARLFALKRLKVLDTFAEAEFDAIVRAASLVCGVPISLISLVDEKRQWFKANVGLERVTETPRELAFCAHTILGDDILEVVDATLDPRFSDNPIVLGDPNIRFYAGVPLRLTTGENIGTLCVIDSQPHQLSDQQRAILGNLAITASHALESHRLRVTERAILTAEEALLEAADYTASIFQNTKEPIIALMLDGTITHWNTAAEKLFGYSKDEILGENIARLVPPNNISEDAEIVLDIANLPEGVVYESQRISKSGELIDVSVSLAPLYNGSGRLIGATKIVHDIREQNLTKRLLAANEAKYRALSDTSPLGVFATDASGACTYTNTRWQIIFGLNHEESLGQGWSDTLHPLDRELVYDEWQRSVSEHIEFDLEFRIRHRDGTIRYVHSRARPMLDANDNITGFVGSVEDVTERRKILDRLTSSEERLRKLYHSTPAMLQSIDPQGKLISVSDYWLEKHGYTREEVIGRHTNEFLDAESAQYARDVVLPMVFQTGFCENIAYKKVKKNGEVFEVLLSSFVERDNAGKPLRAMAVLVDVTAENAAKRATSELLHVIRTQFIYSITDAKGNILDVNDAFCAISQYSRDELVGANHRLVNSGHHPRSFFAAMWQTISQGEVWHGDICNRAKDGTLYWVNSVISPLKDAAGNIERYISIRTDITQRKLAESALFEERQYLASVIEGTQAGTWQWNMATGAARFNNYWAEMLGYSLDELGEHLVRTWQSLVHPDDRPRIEAAQQAHFIGATKAYEVEFRMRHKDGHWIWILSRGRVLSWVDKKQPEWMFGTHIDITARKFQEEALKEANDKVSIATKSGGIGIWSYDVINDLLECDATINALYGLSADDVLTIKRWASLLHPDDRDDTLQAFQDAIEGTRDYDVEFRCIWPDGSVHYIQAKATTARIQHGRALHMLGTNWDVTALRELALEVAKQHETLRVTLQSIGDAVITTDAKGRVTWLNPVAERMTGWLTAEAKGKPLVQIFNILNEETRKAAESPVAACLRHGKVVGLAHHTILISRNGIEYGIEDSASPIRADNGKIIGVVLVFHDVTEQRRLSNEMSYRATHDPLTGLVNRSEFEKRLTRVLNHAKSEGSVHALMFIDLDQFKLVNDACGHTAGDMLLQQVSKILLEIVRSRDTLARLGGDEFGVLLEQCSTEQAQRVAQTICDRMDEYRFIHDGKRFRIGTSIGLSALDGRWPSIANVIQAADTACYTAKEAGRNRVHTWFDTDASVKAHQGEMQWATRLEVAMDENQFELYAQRIFIVEEEHAIQTESKIHAEILLRLRGHDGEMIAPGAFLPAAERFHLASRIDRWVLERVIDWLKSLEDISVVSMICVNLSGQSIGDRAFHVHAIETLMAAGHQLCKRICLEITETATVTNMADASIFIEQVRQLGVSIALDDFGAGASSFGYLKTLKVDILKIDGQFIKAMIHHPLDDSAVRCFVDVADIVGLKTVAEYVESPQILAHVRSLGINCAQGYLMHKPIPIHGLINAGAIN